MDRRLDIVLDGDAYELSGVVYEANVPSANGSIYLPCALEQAAQALVLETFRPLTLPFRSPLLVSDIVGEVMQVSLSDGVMRLVARTLPTARSQVEAFLVSCQNEIAFAGAGTGSQLTDDDDRRVTGFVIRYVGLVPWQED